ncbi:S9 family peptidase [Effusibacillus pohliae]|uniref:S9 family peptidase n=1 Tax=Effusibacillus pohliae TaxID=232270 RepID=UPI00036C12A0|nr:S9 family peptidase [Effusibacillus pohliae]
MNHKRCLTAEDLYRFNWVGEPAVSNRDRAIAFVQKSVNAERSGYRTQIHLVSLNGDGETVFTQGEKDSAPAWSPDGTHLAFLREQNELRQIWIMPRSGGEARRMTDMPRGVHSFIWSPDGRSIAFTARVSEDPLRDKRAPTDEKKFYREQVREINRTRWKADGEGFWDGRRLHLFLLDVAAGSVTRLTEGNFDASEPVWSPDGATIAFVSTMVDDPRADPDAQFYSDVYTVRTDGSQLRKLTVSNLSIMQANFSPDGNTVAFFGHDRSYEGATQTRLYTVGADGGPVVCITEGFDGQIGNVAISDMRSHLRTPPPLFSADGNWIYALVSRHGSVHVYRFSLDGQHEPLTSGDREIYQFTITSDDRYLVAASTNVRLPGDLYRVDLQTGEEVRLTASNDRLLEEIRLSVPETFWFETSDGWNIQGWIMRPDGLQEGSTCPAILEIHGGPHAMYSHSFFHEFQLLAAQGYAVIYTNPRGSHGYGQQFVDACRGDYGGRDYQDLMEAVDYAIANYPFIDPHRLGVTGGSYGGFMTNWIVGHTDRFRAAVTQRSISNWLSFYGVSDIGYYFAEWEVGGNPWDNHELLWQRSPLAYAAQVNTPLLILHGEEDLRCPIEQAEQLFVALKKFGKEVQFVRFPDANHELSRSGNPLLRVERLKRIVGWFNRYIGGDTPHAGRCASSEATG